MDEDLSQTPKGPARAQIVLPDSRTPPSATPNSHAGATGQPQIPRTKKGASKGAFFSDLVEPGGFEPPSASTPLSVLHA